MASKWNPTKKRRPEIQAALAAHPQSIKELPLQRLKRDAQDSTDI